MAAGEPTISMPTLLAVAAAAAVGVASLVAWQTSPGEDPFVTLDAVYAQRGEPPPPPGCRRPPEARQLARDATSTESLARVANPSPEAAYLLARAVYEARRARGKTLELALHCEGFAAAHHLAALASLAERAEVDRKRDEARQQVLEARVDAPGTLAALTAASARLEQDAVAHLEAARAAAPDFLAARSLLAEVLLELDRSAAARAEAEAIIATAPEHAPAYLVRAAVRRQEGDLDGARADLCRAVALGAAPARTRAAALGVQCP